MFTSVTKYIAIKEEVINNIKLALIPLFQLILNKIIFVTQLANRLKPFIKHDLLLGLTNFVVNRFCFQTSEFLHSRSLDHSYNLLVSKGMKIPSWQMKVL